MKFQISAELKEEIEKNFKNYEDLKNKLLLGDPDAIARIGTMAQKGIAPEDVIEAYESNNMDYLYKQAKKKVKLQEMYQKLCDAYAYTMSKEDDRLEGR